MKFEGCGSKRTQVEGQNMTVGRSVQNEHVSPRPEREWGGGGHEYGSGMLKG